MTTTLLLAVLAVTVVVVAGITIIRSVADRKARAALGAKEVRRVDQGCIAGGHKYAAHETGWRCLTCGNHVPRQEGELYGPAEDGRVDRRREPR
jgi:ribosomal protein S26